MPAGTVISGGFPGRIAQEVYPNQKCSGCLHYDGQGGRTGVCTIGLRPDNCGHGEAPAISYAPIARGAGSYLPDLSNHPAQAPEAGPQVVGGLYGSGSTRPVQIQQVSLGEEQLHVVKSVMRSHADLQKTQCLRCSMRGTHGTAPHNIDPQPCSCRTITAEVVAKAVIARMSNALRARVSLEEVAEWVRAVAKAGFRLPAPKTARGAADGLAGVLAQMGVQVGGRSDDDRSGGHLQRAERRAPAPVEDTTSKSMYSDDWINQFTGTPLFDEARSLCEQELEMEAAQLKRREARMKRDKERAAALEKVNAKQNQVAPDFDWQEQDVRRDKIRLAKQRLNLKLVQHRQKQLPAAQAR